MDTSPLRAGYTELLTVANEGGFSEAPTNAWDRDMVLAHIALNDARIAETTQQILQGTPEPRYNNLGTAEHDAPELHALIAEAGADLSDHVRALSEAAADLADQLTAAQEETMVQATIYHDGAIVHEGPMPWGEFLRTHAARHLPMHIEQLRNLQVSRP